MFAENFIIISYIVLYIGNIVLHKKSFLYKKSTIVILYTSKT